MYKKVLNDIEKIENFAANTYNMPAFNILWGGKATEYNDDGFIDTDSREMDQFYNNSYRLSSYYNNIESHSPALSLKILGMVNNEEEKVLDTFMKRIKDGNITVAEAVEKFLKEGAYNGMPLLGETSRLSKNTQKLLVVLAKVEKLNILVKDEYSRTASNQNPLRKALVNMNLENGLENYGDMESLLREVVDDSPELKKNILKNNNGSQSEKMGNFLKSLLISTDGSEISYEEMSELMSGIKNIEKKDVHAFVEKNQLNENWEQLIGVGLLLDDGEKIENIKSISDRNSKLHTLTKEHDSVLGTAMMLSTECFKAKNSAQLATLLFEGGSIKTHGVKGSSVSKIADELKRAIDTLDEKTKIAHGLESEPGAGDFVLAISKNFVISEEDNEQQKKVKQDFFELLMEQDKKCLRVERDSGGAIRKGVPPNARNEQIFSKVFEDLIYNELMKKKKASLIFSQIDREGESRSLLDDGIIDVVDNLKENRYSFIDLDGGMKDKIHSDAIGLKNFDTLIEKISKGEVNGEEISNIIDLKIPFLSAEDKRVLKDNVSAMELEDELLNNPNLENKEDASKNEAELDKLRSHRREGGTPESIAKNYTAGHHGWGLFGTAYGDDKYTLQVGKHIFMSKRKAEFFICLEKASTPEVSSQSQASVTDGCMKEFAGKMKEGKNEYEKALNTVYSGIVPFMAFFIMFRITQHQAMEAKVLNAMVRSGLDEDLMQNYVFGGKNDIEKEFRLKALYVDKNFIDEGCIDKPKEKNYMYQMAVATNEIIKTTSLIIQEETLIDIAEATHEKEVISSVSSARKENLENFGFLGLGGISYGGLKEKTGKDRITLSEDISMLQKEIQKEKRTAAVQTCAKIVGSLKSIDGSPKDGDLIETRNRISARAALLGNLEKTIKHGYERGDLTIEEITSDATKEIPSLSSMEAAIKKEIVSSEEALKILFGEMKKELLHLDKQLGQLLEKEKDGGISKEDRVRKGVIKDKIKSTSLAMRGLEQDKKDTLRVLGSAISSIEKMSISVKRETLELKEMVRERKEVSGTKYDADIIELKEKIENLEEKKKSSLLGGGIKKKIGELEAELEKLEKKKEKNSNPVTQEDIEGARIFRFGESEDDSEIRNQSKTAHRDENLYSEIELLDKYIQKIKDLRISGDMGASGASNIIERVIAQKIIILEGYLKREAIVAGTTVEQEREKLFKRDKDRFLNSSNCLFTKIEQNDKSQVQIITTNKRDTSDGLLEFNEHLKEYLSTGSGKAQIWLAKRGLVASRERSSVSPKAKPSIEETVKYHEATRPGSKTRDAVNSVVDAVSGTSNEPNSFFKRNTKKG